MQEATAQEDRVVDELGERCRARLVAQIVECPIEAIAVGMPVEVTWLDDDPDQILPAFRPAGSGSGA